jgi:phosphate-selective porin OprO/OprP
MLPGRVRLVGLLATTLFAATGAALSQAPPAAVGTAPPAPAQLAEPPGQPPAEAAETAGAAENGGAEVTASARDGFSLRSADGDFALRFRGYLQVDGRSRLDGGGEGDSFVVRRARAILDGTLYGRFGFRLAPDFGGGDTVLQDAYVHWTLAPALALRAGKLKPPLGLERLQSATDLTFVERALPSSLLPNRDVGLQLSGELAGGGLEYALGVFDGAVDGGSADEDTGDAKDLVARLWASPWRGRESPLAGLSFGIAGSRGDQRGTPAAPALGGYRTPGQATFFSYRDDGTVEGTAIADGERLRVAPQAAYYSGPLGLLGEYVLASHVVRRGLLVRELEHEAWQLTAVWVVTGEDAAYGWHAPARGFGDGDGSTRGRGALALTARFHAFAADAESFPELVAAAAVQEARAWAIGIDWTVQSKSRLMLDYEATRFAGLRAGAPRADERVLFLRLQIAW